MKLLLLASAALCLASAARAALPCPLTADDYAALAQSPSKLTEDSAAKLSESATKEDKDKVALLCSTRTFAGKIARNKGAVPKAGPIEKHSPYYLSPAEKKSVNDAVDNWLADHLQKAGVKIR